MRCSVPTYPTEKPLPGQQRLYARIGTGTHSAQLKTRLNWCLLLVSNPRGEPHLQQSCSAFSMASPDRTIETPQFPFSYLKLSAIKNSELGYAGLSPKGTF
jgi:hypothetical protein